MGHLRQHSLQTCSHLKEDILWSYKSVKRGLQECQKRPTKSVKRGLQECQKYKSVKRGPCESMVVGLSDLVGLDPAPVRKRERESLLETILHNEGSIFFLEKKRSAPTHSHVCESLYSVGE